MPLIPECSPHPSSEFLELMVASFVSHSGGCAWRTLIICFSHITIIETASMRSPISNSLQDHAVKKYSNNDRFSVNSVYELPVTTDYKLVDKVCKILWKAKVPQRVRSVLWLVRHNQLLTNEL